MPLHDELLRLIKAGRYADAIELGERARDDPKCDLSVVCGNLSLAYLAVGRFDAAYRCFADQDSSERSKRFGLRVLDLMARAAWLNGDSLRSIEHAKLDVQLLLSGESRYADASGGGSNALFLYYCALKLNDEAAKALAVKLLQKISTRPSFASWPGPLGAYYLGTATVEDVLQYASKQSELGPALAAARQDPLIGHQMIEALFYVAVKKRENGDRASCMQLMAECCALGTPESELEWYLAQKEIEEARGDTRTHHEPT